MRRGFTLIELLVVIAIIGILAAMVFPVFARARESARKVVCVSNVKNIALAFQMYLADHNDTFPPGEHNQDFIGYWLARRSDCEHMPIRANPYLRWPVMLDEYVKNRDVWRCPSAKIQQGAHFIIPLPDFKTYWIVNEGTWGHTSRGGIGYGPCARSWPSGWGGAITDSLVQESYAAVRATGGGGEGGARAFVQGIGTGEDLMHDVKMPAFDSVVATPVCADAGVENASLIITKMAYPDVCRLVCAWPGCCDGGEYPPYPPDDGSALSDPSVRKYYARHLAGVNIGFADGHAAWLSSERLIAEFAESMAGNLSAISSQYVLACGHNSFACDQDCCLAPFLF
jgi:prepilin-type N-terminal cleavage/methylation domain-containing protein/prepilin-type processing-associated H-X9-DG protein